MLSAAFSRVDISDSLIVADAPARSLSFIIVAVVIVSIGVNRSLSQRSLLKKHLLDLCGL
jgi:hypothetical protein